MGNKINDNNKFTKKGEFNKKFIGETKKGENSHIIKMIK